MKRTVFTSLFVSLLIFLPVVPATNTALLYGQCPSGCPWAGSVLVPVVPFMPGLSGCLAVPVPELCAPPPCDPEPADPPTPMVKIKVRVPACSKPGEPIEYRIHVENDSAADAHHVVVKNLVPANARVLQASPEPHVKEPELQWRLGTMKAGGCCDITLLLQPTNQEDLRNCTRVAFEHGQCVTTRLARSGEPTLPRQPEVIPFPRIPGDNEPPTKPGVDEAHQLGLTIDGPKTQYLNVPTSYFVTVVNNGKLTATNLLVDFDLADKAIFVRATENGKHVSGKVAWLLGTLEPGARRTVAVTIKSPVIGELCYQATALADKGAKAHAEFCTRFAGISALSLELTQNDNPIVVGGATSYPVQVRNTGTAPITNLRLTAVIPDSLTLTRAKAPVNHSLGNPRPGAAVLVFEPLPTLEPGAKTDYLIFVQGAKPADARFRIEMTADQLENGAVIQEESTRVYPEEAGPVRVVPSGPAPSGPGPVIRDMSMTRPYLP